MWKQRETIGKNAQILSVPVIDELTHLPLDKMAAILADDIFKWIFLNENGRIPIQISLKFVPRVQLTISQHWFR